jgi:hypothetical protein
MTDHLQPFGEAGPLTRAPSALVIENRVRFESLLADLSAQFVNLPAAQVDDAIQEAQRRIVEELDVDRSMLFIADDDGTFRYTHFWSRSSGPCHRSGLQRQTSSHG